MAKAGRKMKSGARQPNGQIKRPTRDEREANQLRVILNQPHRRGQANPTDQKYESAFGRFCIRNKLREEIYTGGNAYAAKVRRIQAAWGAPTDLRLGEGGKGGEGPSVAAVRGWEADMEELKARVIANCRDGGIGLAGVRKMIFEEADYPVRFDAYLVQASYWIAVEMGDLTAKEGPFS
jgi:hypothetical protein